MACLSHDVTISCIIFPRWNSKLCPSRSRSGAQTQLIPPTEKRTVNLKAFTALLQYKKLLSKLALT